MPKYKVDETKKVAEEAFRAIMEGRRAPGPLRRARGAPRMGGVSMAVPVPRTPGSVFDEKSVCSACEYDKEEALVRFDKGRMKRTCCRCGYVWYETPMWEMSDLERLSRETEE